MAVRRDERTALDYSAYEAETLVQTVRRMALSADGQFIAIHGYRTSTEEDGDAVILSEIHVYRADDYSLVWKTRAVPSGTVYCLSFAFDNNTLAAGVLLADTSTYAVHFFNCGGAQDASAERVVLLTEPKIFDTLVFFQRTGTADACRLMAAAGPDVYIYPYFDSQEFGTRVQVVPLPGTVKSLQYSRGNTRNSRPLDGLLAVTTVYPCILSFTNADNHDVELTLLEPLRGSRAACFVPASSALLVATADSIISEFNLDTGLSSVKVERDEAGRIDGLELAACRESFVAVARKSNRVLLYRIDDGRLINVYALISGRGLLRAANRTVALTSISATNESFLTVIQYMTEVRRTMLGLIALSRRLRLPRLPAELWHLILNEYV